MDPFHTPARLERLIGDLGGSFPRRINIQHLLVYQVLNGEKIVKICGCGRTLNRPSTTESLPPGDGEATGHARRCSLLTSDSCLRYHLSNG